MLVVIGRLGSGGANRLLPVPSGSNRKQLVSSAPSRRLGPRDDPRDLAARPITRFAGRHRNPARGQSAGELTERDAPRFAGRLDIGQHVGGVAIGDRGSRTPRSPGVAGRQLRVAEADTARLGGGERRFCALRYHLALVLGDGGEDVYG